MNARRHRSPSRTPFYPTVALRLVLAPERGGSHVVMFGPDCGASDRTRASLLVSRDGVPKRTGGRSDIPHATDSRCRRELEEALAGFRGASEELMEPQRRRTRFRR
jgi:hypothetical protein